MAIVTPFVQVGTYPTRNFATWDRYSYGRRLLGLQSRACTPSFNLPAPGRRHTPTSTFVFAGAVFLLNSRSHRFFATLFSSLLYSSPTWGIPSPQSYGINLPSSFS